jgi:hypothetical protein
MLPDEDGKPSAVVETGPRYAGKQGKPGKQPRRPRARS